MKIRFLLVLALICSFYMSTVNTMEEIVTQEKNPKIERETELVREIEEKQLSNEIIEDEQKFIEFIKKEKLHPDCKIKKYDNRGYEYYEYIINIAISKDYVNLLRELIERKANVNIVDADGDTPLHYAARKNFENEDKRFEIIQMLVKEDANPNVQNKNKKLPIDMFKLDFYGDQVECKKSKIYKYLGLKISPIKQKDQITGYATQLSPIVEDALLDIKKGSDKSENEKKYISFIEKLNLHPDYQLDNEYILNMAISNDYVELLKKIIERGANLNIKDNYSNSMLFAALSNIGDEDKRLEIVKVLIENGVNPRERGLDGKLAIDIIDKNSKYQKIYKYLLKEAQKTYNKFKSNSRNIDTLDLVIFLDKTEEQKADKEQGGPTCREFANCIKCEEVIIATASIYRTFNILSTFTRFSPTFNFVIKSRDELFCTNNWSIFITKDKEFVIFIPNSKYPEIKKLADIKKIGLNPDIVEEFMLYKDMNPLVDPEVVSKKLYDNLNKNNEHETILKSRKIFISINMQSLIDIFSNTIKNMRVVLMGHGKEAYQEDYGVEKVAGLEFKQYRNLRDRLNNRGCSCLYVTTCFGGENILRTQTFNIKLVEQLESKIDQLSSKNFIEVAEGIPGYSVTGGKIGFNKFFSNVNNFFKVEKIAVATKIRDDQNLEKDEKNYILKNLTEQQILTGKFQRSSKPDNNLYDIGTIVSRHDNINDNIKKSQQFLKIFSDFTLLKSENLPRVRFPGDREMLPVKEIFSSELINEVKGKLTRILGIRNRRLKSINEDLGKTSLNPQIKLIISKEKKDIEAEKKDITKYMEQLG